VTCLRARLEGTGMTNDLTHGSHNTGLDRHAAIEELGKILLGEQPLADIFEKVTRLAQAVVPGADHASLTLVENDQAHTPAFTGEVALRLDERQYETGFGPCLDAAASGRTISILDTSNEGTYPGFAAQARSLGVRRVMSVALPVPQRTLGAINMYGMGETPFDQVGTEAARGFASHAAVALANAALYENTARFAEQMQQALKSRAVIDQAKGILMRDNHITADEAFAMLTQASNRSNRKLREIAQTIVETTARGA
jgi:GAF domain-containing protein